MPQYEVHLPDTLSPVRIRARDAADAVRLAVARAAGDDEAVSGGMTLGDPEPGSGWRAVTLGGEPCGRVREHNRMRFRRD